MTGPLRADRRLGIVQSISTGPPRVSVTLGGDEDPTHVVDAAYLDSYAPAVGDVVQVLSNQAAPLVLGRAGTPGHVDHYTNNPGLSTTSGTFVTITNSTAAASVVKERAGTRLKVDLRVSLYTTVADTEYELAMRFASTDYAVMDAFINPASQHGFATVVRYVASVPAGTHAVEVRARRTSGTGTLTMNNGDVLSYTVDEVA